MTASQKAPCVVEVVAGPTEEGAVGDFELFYARRALAKLKALLGRHAMQELLAADIERGNALLRESLELSDGAFRPATTKLAIRGLRAVQFLEWLENAFGDEPAMLAAEPEHYVVAPNPDRTVTVVENIGPYLCRVHLPAFDSEPVLTPEILDALLPESDYPYRRIATVSLPDGTVVGHMLTQFSDSDVGFNATLTAFFPASCPEEVFEQHRQHLAVEFSNWIRAAAASRG